MIVLKQSIAYELLVILNKHFPYTRFVTRGADRGAGITATIIDWTNGPTKAQVRTAIFNFLGEIETDLILLNRAEVNENFLPYLNKKPRKQLFPYEVKAAIVGATVIYYGLFESTCDAVKDATDRYVISAIVARPI